MDRLDPARTALVLVHMVKGVAGDVDTPFSRLFRQRAEEAGSSGLSSDCWTGSARQGRWWSGDRVPAGSKAPRSTPFSG
jgi:hypothetical protein